MLNRTLPPAFHPIETIALLEPEKETLSNGVQQFVFDSGEQELLRIQWVFPHVDFNPEKSLRHSMMAGLILEGTSAFSNKEIAEKVDFYGAFLQPEFNADQFTLTLFSLQKHVQDLLPLIRSVLQESIFPEKECVTYRRNARQNLLISLEKGDYLAKRTFNHALYGDSIYGYQVQETDFDLVQRDDLLDIYQKQIRPDNCLMFVAGKCTPEILENLKDIFGNEWTSKQETLFKAAVLPTAGKAEEILVPRKHALQAAIRIGQRSIQRDHVDFPRLQLLNSILGGYFGSRLMRNIREEKGYTYGIGSGLISWRNTAYFTIATEVGVEYQKATLEEIQKELRTLQEQSVEQSELNLVKNYILGSFVGSLENVFSHVDKFKQAYLSNLDNQYYSYYMEQIQSAQPKDLQALAQTYLNYEDMFRVIVA